ncbi:Inositol 2-dehydrogenase_D-chiro-inositol 3-dehydrogenase [Streptomyces sp. enrichment culture]
MTEPLGVAVPGAGHMGADHIRRPDRVVSGARVAAVADPDAARAEDAVAGIDGVFVHTDAGAALDAPGAEAVLIASPGPAHEEALLAAFARGLPVLCEKPMVPDPAGALRVVEAEARLGRVTGPGTWDGYAAAVAAEAGVRSLGSGARVTAGLAPRPALRAGT